MREQSRGSKQITAPSEGEGMRAGEETGMQDSEMQKKGKQWSRGEREKGCWERQVSFCCCCLLISLQKPELPSVTTSDTLSARLFTPLSTTRWCKLTRTHISLRVWRVFDHFWKPNRENLISSAGVCSPWSALKGGSKAGPAATCLISIINRKSH